MVAGDHNKAVLFSTTVVNLVSLLSDSSVLFKTVSVGHPPLQMLLCSKQAGGYELTKLNIYNSSWDNRQETVGFKLCCRQSLTLC